MHSETWPRLALTTSLTARVTYGLVFGTPCRTATLIAQILQRQGWNAQPRQCPQCSTTGRRAA